MIEAKRGAPRVNGGNDSASWPFPHLSSAPAMDRHPRVDLRDFAEFQSIYACEKDKDHHPEDKSDDRGCCVNGLHPPPTRHPREVHIFS